MCVFDNYWKKGVLSICVIARKMAGELSPPVWPCLLASGLLPSIEGKRHCFSSQPPGFQLNSDLEPAVWPWANVSFL